MPAFQIVKEKIQEGLVLLTVKGFLDAHTYEQLEKTIDELIDSGTIKIIVDLSSLDYISSAGAGVFIGAVAKAQENDGNLVLMRPSTNVREVFDLLGLSQIFTFKNTKEEAVRALQ